MTVLSPWKAHVAKWQDCERCQLYHGRRRVVLARGKVPCDVVFVAEAPGMSEDVLGEPLVGPAGKLLDDCASEAGLDAFRLLYTNLVGCFPKDAKATDDHRPPDDAIKACLPRVGEVFRIARPRAVVLVGSLAKTWLQSKAAARLLTLPPDTFEIVHPSAVLRAPTAQKSLLVRRLVATLTRVTECLR